jgi:TonB dependent receptor/TonB-dependent Receptor Plug Domain
MVTTVLLMAALGLAQPSEGGQPSKYAGRPVADVLRELQTAELRIIFSDDLVPAALRVKFEPSSRNSREIAEQILAPHGLTLQKGPRGTLVVVVRPKSPQRLTTPRVPASPSTPPTEDPPPSASPGPVRIQESVEVTDRLRETGSAAGTYTIEPSGVREMAGSFENVFQTLQVFPGAVGINDDDGKLAVRGGGPEHNLIVVDGVQIHRPQRLGHFTASFLNPDTIERVSLDASGLDARYGGRLSSVTTIETRDGVPDRSLAASGSLGLTSGDVLLEGRLPKTETGSWWLTARGTYYRAVFDRFNRGVTPGFSDVQFKVAVRPTQRTRLTVFGLAGRETLRQIEIEPEGGEEFRRDEYRGDNRLGVLNFTWMPSSRFVTTTTASAYAHDELDYAGAFVFGGDPFERDTRVQDVAVAQRFVFGASARHLLDGGLELRRVRSAWRMDGVKQPEFWRGLGPSTWGELIDYGAGPIDSQLSRTQAGFWLQDRIAIAPAWAIEPGIRIDWNSYTGESAWQPRIRLNGRVGRTTLWTGVAVQAQTPSHESLQGLDFFDLTQDSGRDLRNERSRQVVAGFERTLWPEITVRVEAYHRRFDRLLVQRLETDAERASRLSIYQLPPDLPADDVVLEYRPTVHPESTGTGKATGLEMLVRLEGRRLNGWFGYTLSKATRELHGHEVPFDFDRRHAFAAVGLYQLSRRWRVSGTWQHASGFPVTPLHEEVAFGRTIFLDGTIDPIARTHRRRDGTLMTILQPFMRRLGLRNSDHLSPYSRTDVRVTFSTGHHWEFYGEVINLFNHRNYLIEVTFPAVDNIPESVSRSNIYTEFERIPTAGVRFRF